MSRAVVADAQQTGGVAVRDEIKTVTSQPPFVLRRWCGLWGRGT